MWIQRPEPAPVLSSLLARAVLALLPESNLSALSTPLDSARAPTVVHIFATVPFVSQRILAAADDDNSIGATVRAAVEVEVPFEKALLTLDAYPPDVSRGFDLPPVATAVLGTFALGPLAASPFTAASANEGFDQDALVVAAAARVPGAWQRYAFAPFAGDVVESFVGGLIVQLPYPDASMPFNAIAVVCTVIAFFFGSLFNLLYNSDDDFVLLQRSNKLIRKCAKRPDTAAAAATATGGCESGGESDGDGACEPDKDEAVGVAISEAALAARRTAAAATAAVTGSAVAGAVPSAAEDNVKVAVEAVSKTVDA